jgi:hypothetical protein
MRIEFGRKLRILLIAAGYVTAAAIGSCYTCAVYSTPAMAQQSSGMAAFGELLCFIGSIGGLALVPTFFLLRELAGFGWLWKLCAACGALAGLVALLAEARLVLLFLLGGYKYKYPDPAFFNLSCLAWLYYKAGVGFAFWLAPAECAVTFCCWLATPKSASKKILGWSLLALLSAAAVDGLWFFLMGREHFFHP